MTTPTQRQYLDAMGIQLWQLRDHLQENDEAAMMPKNSPETEQGSMKTLPGKDWDRLKQQVVACQACDLHKTRTQTVFGIGNINADWLVIGEAPGADEDRKGEPFVGRAGILLNSMLLALELKREQVYIANILKCRPPNNRDPNGKEVACCESFLKQQVALIKPKIILTVGRIAAQNLLKTDVPIGRLRGKKHCYGDANIPVVATYHPAYLLRSPTAKRKAWDDLQLAQSIVKNTL